MRILLTLAALATITSVSLANGHAVSTRKSQFQRYIEWQEWQTFKKFPPTYAGEWFEYNRLKKEFGK